LDPSDATQLIILFVILILTALFTASETALSAVTKLQMQSLADENIRGAKTVCRLIEDPTIILRRILIGKVIFYLTASTLTITMTTRILGNRWNLLAVILLFIFFIIMGESIPKSVAAAKSEKVALGVSYFISFLTSLLVPIDFIVCKINSAILLIFDIDPNIRTFGLTQSELRAILENSHDEGGIESEERRMITNVVDFGDALTKDVMVPRIDMAFVNVEFSYEELVQAFSEEKYTRMPVYSETRDNVIGIVNLKDVFFYNGKIEDFNIKDIMRDPFFTYEYKKTSELLIEMRKESIPMAIVLDEYGATAGLITIEDLLEEIVGEIRDEYDYDEEDCIRELNENEYIVDGNTKLDEINELLNLNLESKDYDSIAGHIISILDHLPVEGETVTEQNVTFTVASVDKNRIDKVHVLINMENEDAEPTTED